MIRIPLLFTVEVIMLGLLWFDIASSLAISNQFTSQPKVFFVILERKFEIEILIMFGLQSLFSRQFYFYYIITCSLFKHKYNYFDYTIEQNCGNNHKLRTDLEMLTICALSCLHLLLFVKCEYIGYHYYPIPSSSTYQAPYHDHGRKQQISTFKLR